MHLVVIQAEFGDCLVLEHQVGSKVRRFLIDGGPDGIFAAHLRPYVEAVAKAGGDFEAVVLSHVDNDHVTGLLDLFSELRAQHDGGTPELVKLQALWHNSFSLALGDAGIDSRVAALFQAGPGGASAMPTVASSVLGYGEGSRLRVEAITLGVPLNAPFPDGQIVTDTAPAIDGGGLSLRFVAPSQANLRALRREWVAWLTKHESAVAGGDPLAAIKADTSVPNLSSVCILASSGGRSILLTGDARGDDILENLEQLNLLPVGGQLHVDVLKMPHHGSDRNVDPSFFDRLTANRYVFSANGRYGNPDMATLIWLVEALKRGGRTAQIVATNRTESLARLVALHPPATSGYRLRFIPPGQSWISVPAN
jgi:hypothetical protein